MVLKELLVKLGLDVNEQSFAKGQIAANLLTAALQKGISLVMDFGRSIADNVHHTIEYGERMQKMSQEVGIGKQALQELIHAGFMSGVGMEELGQSVGFLSRNLMEAQRGSKMAQDAFRGMNLKKPNGEFMSADEALGVVADEISKMPAGMAKTARAMDIFGRAGKKMIPFLNEGSKGIAKARKEAEELGLVLSDKATKASEEYTDNMERIKLLTTGLWRQAIGPLIPELNKLLEQFFAWKKADQGGWIKGITKVGRGLITVLRGLGHVLEAVTHAWKTIAVVLGFGGLIWIMTALGSISVTTAATTAAAWALAALPFIAIGAAIAALFLIFEDLQTYAEGGDSLFGDLMKYLGDLMQDRPDWWFTKALKAAMGFVNDMIFAVQNLSGLLDALGEELAKEIDIVVKPLVKLAQIAGLAPTGEDGAAKGAWFLSEEKFQKRLANVNDRAAFAHSEAQTVPMAPEYRAPGTSTANTNTQNNNVQMTIIQQKGEDSEALSQRINNSLYDIFAEAHPAVSGG